jgi:hypothetical protein
MGLSEPAFGLLLATVAAGSLLGSLIAERVEQPHQGGGGGTQDGVREPRLRGHDHRIRPTQLAATDSVQHGQPRQLPDA